MATKKGCLKKGKQPPKKNGGKCQPKIKKGKRIVRKGILGKLFE